MIHLCVTTFNRQDLLPKCLRSAFAGTRRPDSLTIVDQRNVLKYSTLLSWLPPNIDLKVLSFGGCEASAINWYLTHVDEERIIAHDDVIFGPTSLEQFVATKGDFLIDSQQGVITYRNRCRDFVGLYDTTISPGSYKYVDVDYEDRLALAGILPVVVDCGITHTRDGTMRAYDDLAEYNRREMIARGNYEHKWGRSATGNSTIERAKRRG